MSQSDNPFLPCRACVCSSLRKASRAVTQHYENRFRGSGLRATQFTILSTLALTGPIPLTRLANFLGLERTTLTRNLAPLERRSLLTLTAGADPRIRQIEITAEGEALALKLLPRWRDAQQSVREVLKQHGLSGNGSF